ncbi:MAG: alpha/beta fold hydrolase [Aureliella sp.]
MSERLVELVLPAGHTLAVRVVGSGRPVMLVHGFPLDSGIWRKQFEPLVERGFAVFAPDLRGFGSSSPIDRPCSLGDLAEDLFHVRNTLVEDRPMSLVGLSMGGYVAFEYWKRHGETLERLVLADTKPSIDTDDARRGRLAMAEAALQTTTWEAVAPMLPRLLSSRTLERDQETTQWLKAMMSRVPAKTIATMQQAMAQRHDFTGELSSIRVPTLVVAGEHDAISPPEENRQWAAQIRGAVLEIVPDAGHLPQVENSEGFNRALLDFLAS